MKENTTDFTNWSNLLQQAITTPGLISRAYSFFHTYSLSNQLLAMVQCYSRQIEAGPIATFPAWKERKRYVKKGEKALTLCMPITVKDRTDSSDDPSTFTKFVYKRNWFVLSQTEGEPIEAVSPPTWSKAQALSVLGVSEIPFEKADGNCQGYAIKRSIAISPIAMMPFKTTFHELGHVVIGHTTEADISDSDLTPRNLREVEAESVALILCDALGLEGAVYCRGYIQHWLGEGNEIPTESAQKIFKAADQILKAGQAEKGDASLDDHLAPSEVKEYHEWLDQLDVQEQFEIEESQFRAVTNESAQKGAPHQAEKRLERMRQRIVSALRTTMHAQACINELFFMNGDTLESIERDLSDALQDLQAIASR